VAEKPKEPEKVDTPKYTPIPSDMLRIPGVGDMILDQMKATAPKHQPEFEFAATLSLLGTAMGGLLKFKDRAPNILSIGIGKSSSGKNHSKECAAIIMASCGLESELGAESVTSGAAIASMLAARRNRLFLFDEFDSLLSASVDKKAGAHQRDVIRTLLTSFTSSTGVWRPMAYADEENNKVIFYPNLNFYACCTPDAFFSATTEEMVSRGFLGRVMLFLENPNPVPFNDARKDIGALVTPSIRALLPRSIMSKALDSTGAAPVEVGASKAALKMLADRRKDFDASVCKSYDDEHPIRTMLGRTYEYVQKVALIRAWSIATEMQCVPAVGEDDVSEAADLCEFVAMRAAKYVEDRILDSSAPEVSALVVKVRSLIKKSPGISEATIKNRLARNSDGRNLALAIRALCFGGEVMAQEVTTKNGRKVNKFSPATIESE
jgi:hypothetical protein